MFNVESNNIQNFINLQIDKFKESKNKEAYIKIFGAALSSIPWFGAFLNAALEINNDSKKNKQNHLKDFWIEEHANKINNLSNTLSEIVIRLEQFPQEINERLQSEEYLQLVRKAFRIWDNSDTIEKRELVQKLLTNAGASKLVQDDIIRLFLDWIGLYHEVHFEIIRQVYNNKVSRSKIWNELNGSIVREDSLEADLFKLLIRDLSTGGVIRQVKKKDFQGNFIKDKPTKKTGTSALFKSAFDEKDEYELTELGRHFVHYTLNDLVSRIA